MLDVLLPRTDAGVLVQLVTTVVGFVVVLVLVRPGREVRTLVTGLFVATLGFFALRAVH